MMTSNAMYVRSGNGSVGHGVAIIWSDVSWLCQCRNRLKVSERIVYRVVQQSDTPVSILRQLQ